MLDRLIQAVRRHPDSWVIVGAVGLAVLLRLPTLHQPLLEAHEFRQTQTAYTASLYHEQGIDLLHAPLPVLGPPYDVPFEFPLFQAVASLVMEIGIPPDPALRATGLAFFVLTGVFTWGLVRHVAGRGAGIGALLFFLFSPFSIVWSRTSMIEYLATALAVGALWAGLAWRDAPRPWLWAIVLGAATLAMVVKITTAIFWLVPLILYRATRDLPGLTGWVRVRLDPGFLALLGLPFVAGLAWTAHADAIKAASPATAWLTTEAIGDWAYGTMAQRQNVEIWVDIGERVAPYLVGLPFLALIPFAAWAAFRSGQTLFWVGIVLAGFLPIIVVFNLYWIHDYYLAAISPVIAAMLGLGAAKVVGLLRPRRWLQVGALAVFGLAWAFTMWSTQDYWRKVYDPVSDGWGVLGMAAELAAATSPDDEVVIAWKDWSPSILYYGRRRGMMVQRDSRAGLAIDALDKGPYAIYFAADPQGGMIWPLREWPWIGVLGPRTYAVGQTPDDLRGAGLLATDDSAAWEAAVAVGTSIEVDPRAVPCDGGAPYEVPAGRSGTWLHFGSDPPREARIDLATGLAPVPVRSYIFIDAKLAPAGSRILGRCLGATNAPVQFIEALDAPGPLSR